MGAQPRLAQQAALSPAAQRHSPSSRAPFIAGRQGSMLQQMLVNAGLVGVGAAAQPARQGLSVQAS